jgi:hypothetical protein
MIHQRRYPNENILLFKRISEINSNISLFGDVLNKEFDFQSWIYETNNKKNSIYFQCKMNDKKNVQLQIQKELQKEICNC